SSGRKTTSWPGAENAISCPALCSTWRGCGGWRVRGTGTVSVQPGGAGPFQNDKPFSTRWGLPAPSGASLVHERERNGRGSRLSQLTDALLSVDTGLQRATVPIAFEGEYSLRGSRCGTTISAGAFRSAPVDTRLPSPCRWQPSRRRLPPVCGCAG